MDEFYLIEIPPVINRRGIGRLFPLGFRYELKELLKLAIPIALTSLANELIGPISIMFSGHLGALHLATAGLAISVFNVTGYAVASGLLAACDTLFAQNHVYPPLFFGVLSNLVNALLHYILLFRSGFGINGSPIAQAAAYFTQVACLVIYTRLHSMKKITWNNYSTQILNDWGQWFTLAVPGLFMITLEWTVFEVGSLVAGTLGETQLAAQAIIYNLEAMAYTMLPYGIGVAASIRVGHFLGARCAIGPRSVSSVSFILTFLLSMPISIIFATLRWHIPRLFTEDEDTIALAASTLPILAIVQMFDSIMGVMSGVIRGAGLQYIGALISIFGLYLVGISLSMSFVYALHMGIQGFWWGLSVGAAIAAMAYFVIVIRIDWDGQVKRAIERLQISTSNPDLELIPREILNPDSKKLEVSAELESYSPIPDEHCTPPSPPPPINQQPNQRKRAYKRALLIGIFVIFYLVCLLCRTNITLEKHFGVYCLYSNGTFTQFWNTTEAHQVSMMTNCTMVIP